MRSFLVETLSKYSRLRSEEDGQLYMECRASPSSLYLPHVAQIRAPFFPCGSLKGGVALKVLLIYPFLSDEKYRSSGLRFFYEDFRLP